MQPTTHLFILSLLFMLMPHNAGGQTPGNYLPTEVGNQWLLAYIDGPNVIPDTFYTPLGITNTVSLNDTTYHILSQSFIERDTFRVDTEGRVWRWHMGQEKLWLDFTAPDDSVYQYIPRISTEENPFAFNVTVSRDLTIATYAGTFEHCISFFFDYPPTIDDEITYTFAPDVGLIKIESFGTYGQLFSAQVGDSTITTRVSTEAGFFSQQYDAELEIYPNPVAEQAWVAMETGTPSYIEIEIYDVLGRRVASPQSVTLPAGKHNIPLTIEGLAPATYLLRLSTSNQAAITKMFVKN